MITQQTNLLTTTEIKELLSENTEALNTFNKSQNSKSLAIITGFLGGALMGFPISELVTGKKPNLAVMALGGGLIGTVIPINNKANRTRHEAVALYNAGIEQKNLDFIKASQQSQHEEITK